MSRKLPVVLTPEPRPGSEVPEERLFPDLTPQQEAFVCEYLADPTNATACAIKAGYGKASAHVTASRLLRHQGVIRALQEGTAKLIGVSAVSAAIRVAKLSISAKSEYVQLEASKDLLDRAGMAAPKRINLGGALSVTFDLGE